MDIFEAKERIKKLLIVKDMLSLEETHINHTLAKVLNILDDCSQDDLPAIDKINSLIFDAEDWEDNDYKSGYLDAMHEIVDLIYGGYIVEE